MTMLLKSQRGIETIDPHGEAGSLRMSLARRCSLFPSVELHYRHVLNVNGVSICSPVRLLKPPICALPLPFVVARATSTPHFSGLPAWSAGKTAGALHPGILSNL